MKKLGAVGTVVSFEKDFTCCTVINPSENRVECFVPNSE